MAVSVALGLTTPRTGSECPMPIAPSPAGLAARLELEVRPDSAEPRLRRVVEKAFAAEKRVAEQRLVVAVKLGRVRSLQRNAAAKVIALSAEFKTEAQHGCKVTMDSPAWVTPALVEVAEDSVAEAVDSVAAEVDSTEAAEAGDK